MPYKFETDKLKIKKEDDNRRKLTDDERLEISRLYGKISQRKLAKMFSVSRRTIVFIGCPEKHKQNLECRAARGGSKQYYDTEKNTIAIQKCRLHKKDLNKKSKLKVEKMTEYDYLKIVSFDWVSKSEANIVVETIDEDNNLIKLKGLVEVQQ